MSKKQGFIKGLGLIAFVLNLISIVSGVLYLVLPPGGMPLHNLWGGIFLVALTVNLLLAYLNDVREEGRVPRPTGTVYLVFSLLAIPAMSLGGLASSSTYEPSGANLILYLVVYPAFWGLFIIGLWQGWLSMQARTGLGYYGSHPKLPSWRSSKKASRGQKVFYVIFVLLMLLGIFFVYILLTDYLGLTQILVSQNALFMAFFFLTLTVLFLKVHKALGSPVRYIASAAGLVMFVLFLLPLFLMPNALEDAEMAFADAFGDDWEERIDPAHEDYFRPYELSLPAYFLSIPSADYVYERDVLYYWGLEGVDEGREFYYDVYMPPPDAEEGLPGEGSVLIRIHGGAWIAGGKGFANMMQMNKYFASQGYTVFDIQYGLSDRVDLAYITEEFEFLSFLSDSWILESMGGMTAPEHVRGPFTLDDMVRHLGIFTMYLEENAPKYGVNLDSVFISGGSAGGHLTTAMALAIAGGEYEDIFSPAVEVKGYVPFYPGNKAHEILDVIGGAEEWRDVELLVDTDSPPCLIYQGTGDGMVPPETARSFYEQYRQMGNESCAVIYLPLAAHASDFQFASYYNQPFLYYMERFLSLHGE